MILDVPQGDVGLLVNGMLYQGWESVHISRSLGSVCDSFSLTVSDKWAGLPGSWTIREEDDCVLSIDTFPILTGIVDDRDLSFDSERREISIAGRSRTSEIVDNSIVGPPWDFSKASVLPLLNKLTAPFGVTVTADPSAEVKPIPEDKIAINPGETPFDLVDRVARYWGAIAIADPFGNVLITRPGLKAAPVGLIEGQNVKSGSAKFSRKDRFATYLCLAQKAGFDDLFSEAISAIIGQAIDADVKRKNRVHVFESEKPANISQANDRAEWEKKYRAARAIVPRVTVQGWYGAPGYLWSPGDTVPVTIPSAGLAGTMLIDQVDNVLDDKRGKVSDIYLARPDAYLGTHITERTWKL